MEYVDKAQFEKCDKYDYLLSVACGAAAGLVDIFLVGAPGQSVLGGWTDAQTDRLVMNLAQKLGWSGNANDGNIASAIGYFERRFPVNYDQRFTSEVKDQFQMGTRNHHLKSLSHSPDPIGLFFSILDQFQGKSSFLANGQLIRIDTSESDFELQGGNFHAKLFCGFCNWIGHILSDVAGSSGGRGQAGGRGSGLAVPFYELFLFCDVGQIQIGKDRQSFATLMTRVFQEGYDLRFGAAMAIPVMLNELFIRVIWALKRRFYHHYDWAECIPTNQHGSLRCMLIVGTATLCLFDGIDALFHSGGNPIQFIMRLNLIAWFRLIMLVLREIMRRYGLNYRDLAKEFQKINLALDSYLAKLRAIDFEGYEREVRELSEINALCERDDEAATSALYQYFNVRGIDLQFHSFEEFDQKNLDPTFVLKI